jgi:hypothetical protein
MCYPDRDRPADQDAFEMDHWQILEDELALQQARETTTLVHGPDQTAPPVVWMWSRP